MRTTEAWAFKRQLIYGTFFTTLFILLVVFLYFRYFYNPATCFDGSLNGDELAIDCGGSCVRICPFEVSDPVVKWSRSFEIRSGLYNAVGYVENMNREASTKAIPYTFKLYDADGLITERSGTTVLPPDNVYPIFAGRIDTGGRTPTRTFLELGEAELWQPSPLGREQFTVVDRSLSGADSEPRLDAVIENTSLEEAREVEVVATIFDQNGNALTASETFVDNFAPRSKKQVVFTWPEPIATTLRSCEVPTDVVMAVDLSGSMNNDGGDPPEPISSVINAASSFVSRLGGKDQISIVSFASDAVLERPLGGDTGSAIETIKNMSILPEEETGNTNTGEAFVRAREEFTTSRHNSDARKVMVILTDGLATAPREEPEVYALTEAATLKNMDVEVYAIGLGQQVNMDFVRAIATDQSYAFQALSSTDVDAIYQSITAAICEDGPAVIEIIPKSDASFVPLQ
ncbi:VWA domain-containing protein [Candidatus Kaiserbacteria bacterium]|nr:VWA domain-containing protein [Candidatus Kaiserbacteria bacterium]MCB9811660.1 VWA domain-containing protein [Candidatus Nomurabacteria bacterium]